MIRECQFGLSSRGSNDKLPTSILITVRSKHRKLQR